MNKSKYFIGFAIILVTAIVVFAYNWWEDNYNSLAWPLIPSHAVMVVESRNPLQLLQEWEETKVGKDIFKIPYFRKIVARADTLIKVEENIHSFFEKKPVYTSLHVTARDDFDYIFYIPLRSSTETQLVSNFSEKFRQNRRYRWHTRNFQGHQISEISSSKQKLIFSYIIYRQHLIGSYTPFLIEDVIRKINSLSSLQESAWTKIGGDAVKATSDVQLYIKAQTLPRLLQIFEAEHDGNHFLKLSNYARFTQFAITQDESNIRLEGISKVNSKNNQADYLEVFKNQSPQLLSCLPFIPNSTAILYHWGFSDAKRFGFSLYNHWKHHSIHTLHEQDTFQTKYLQRPSSLFDWMKGEIALAVLESNKKESQQLLFIQASNIEVATNKLEEIAKAVDTKENIDPYTEKYADVSIRQLSIREFPSLALGDIFKGFEQSFYAPVGQYIVFSNNIQNIKNMLDDIRNDNVWSNSGRQKELLQQIAGKANFGMYIHTARALNLFYAHASPRWKNLMYTYSSELKKLEHIALQIQYRQENIYQTDILVKYNSRQIAQQLQNKFLINTSTAFDNALYTPLYLVKNHIDKTREVLIQDSKQQLHLINTQGKVIWKKQLSESITSQISQIDFYKNNKLQYLFTTPSKLYVVDRNGNTLDNFPVHLPSAAQLETVSAIDYDKNHDYRFLASDIKGNLYLCNEQGKLLDGWNPLSLGYRLNSPARHIRIRSKDYIIVSQTNGVIHALNRKGMPYAGFPLNLNARLYNPLFIEAGIEPDETIFTTITDSGEMISFNLLGKILSRRQFYRPSRETIFKLCIEANQKDWLISRQDGRKISFMDKQGNILFEKDYDVFAQPIIQYYDFGADFKVIAVTYPSEQQTYLYDDTGKSIGEGTIKNSQPLAILYVENFGKLLIYRASKQEAGLVSVKVQY